MITAAIPAGLVHAPVVPFGLLWSAIEIVFTPTFTSFVMSNVVWVAEPQMLADVPATEVHPVTTFPFTVTIA